MKIRVRWFDPDPGHPGRQRAREGKAPPETMATSKKKKTSRRKRAKATTGETVRTDLDPYEKMKAAVVQASYERFAKELRSACPDSRERSLALTNLEQAKMWAIAAIKRSSW